MPRQKLRDDSQPVWLPLSQVWPFREYKWKRGFARRSDEEWDELRSSMAEKGWDPRDPLWLDIGERGGVKVGEGNHRLAIAKELGIKEVPVRFSYSSGRVAKTKIVKHPETGHPTPIDAQKKKKAKTEPVVSRRSSVASPESEKWLDDLLDMLGRR